MLWKPACARIVSHLDPVPPLVDEGARAAFGWRTIDADLAELMRDSADELAEAGVRGPGGPRQLSFESPALGIELEVVETGPRVRRVEGQLLPPGEATVMVERPTASRPCPCARTSSGASCWTACAPASCGCTCCCGTRRSPCPGPRSSQLAPPVSPATVAI